jgi:hypothetical protein
MAEKKKKDHEQRVPPAVGKGPAVPPPDDPLLRHEHDADAAADQEAARLRLKAILQTQRMPKENDEPEKKDGS